MVNALSSRLFPTLLRDPGCQLSENRDTCREGRRLSVFRPAPRGRHSKILRSKWLCGRARFTTLGSCDRANTAFEAEVKPFGGFIYRQASGNPERHAGAGRFFVYPKSHLIDMAKNGGDFDIAFHHDRYKELVKRVITEPGLFFRGASPEQRGRWFWAAKTIHGSLRMAKPTRSRRFFTAHFVPDRSRFLQCQSSIQPLKTELVNGMKVHHPKDLSNATNRAILFVETRFPRAFQITKRAAIKLITR
jgi:hypothetical protein